MMAPKKAPTQAAITVPMGSCDFAAEDELAETLEPVGEEDGVELLLLLELGGRGVVGVNGGGISLLPVTEGSKAIALGTDGATVIDWTPPKTPEIEGTALGLTT